MMQTRYFGCILLLAIFIEIVSPICVLESDFGFKINCAFKKSGLFRVRNLGGLKAHASIGFSLGDELGFEQSLTNLDPSRRRSVSVKNGAPPNLVDVSRTNNKQEKRGKQNRIMMRPVAPPISRPNQAAMDSLSSLHRRVSTMQPIVVGPTVEAPPNLRPAPTTTLAKPMAMGIPAFKPLPPKEDTLKVVPITAKYSPLQIPQSKGPGLIYQSEIYPHTHNQISKMVSQMTAVQYAQPMRITPQPIILQPLYRQSINQFMPMPTPLAPPPTVNPFSPQGLTIIPAPVFKQINTKPNPVLDPVSHQVHDLSSYAYNTKKVDDYNSITGYSDDTVLKFNKEDINSKIAEIAKAGNISMEAVEAAIALRQQQLLSKYASIPVPTTTTTTTTTVKPVVFADPEPEIVLPTQKPKRAPTAGKVMNAPREYYPVGYEKNFDDHFQSKVELPDTSFHCGDQKYFPGLYGDESLGCMVFHVCALTDDGLVMKSFLCPESTLFDQTILKCNWWFYVDCKNTRKLYDTNIPVSKSYQLMKALTFFSSYKKEMEDGRPTNPEDVHGVKEAITILENQDSAKQESKPNVQIITPHPIIDERNNHKTEYATEPAPIYRENRNINNTKTRNNVQRNSNNNSKQSSSQETSSEYKLITVQADMDFNKTSNASSSEVRDKTHRRRMTLRYSNSTTIKPTTTKLTTTKLTTSKPIVSSPVVTSPLVELIKQEIQPIEVFEATVKQEKLTDQLEASYSIDPASLKDIQLPEVKRFYRSSAEKLEKEMTVINNEKVQIIRPTPMARLVGQFATPTAVIEKLDEAILGKQNEEKNVETIRTKKEAIWRPISRRRMEEVITIVTPERHTKLIEKT